MGATIVDIAESGVIIRIPSGERTIMFDEIIQAETVIRYWLAKDLAPVESDFRKPEVPEISAIYDSSYAPALAERVRRLVDEVGGLDNYTDERDQVLGDTTVDEIAREIELARNLDDK